MFNSDVIAYLVLVLLNGANVVYLASYSVRDVLWLRILAVVAMLMMLPYYYAGTPQIQWSCIFWQLAFMAINLVWIGLIIKERRPPRMNDDERILYERDFKNFCSPREMLALLKAATWKTAESSSQLVKRETNLHKLLLIHEGHASVFVADEKVAELGPGDLVGEMSFLTGDLTVADVFADSPIRYLAWDRFELIGLFDGRIELRSALHELIGRDLIAKLTSQQAKVPELSVESSSHG